MTIHKKRARLMLPFVMMGALAVTRDWTDDWLSPEASKTPSPYGAGDPKLTATNMAGGPLNPFLTDGHAVQLALAEIARHSGKPLRVTSMWADRTDGLSVDVRTTRHTNVDRYTIAPDGTFAGPQPVRVTAPNDARDSAFDPQAIAFARMAQTARQAIVKSKFPDSRVSAWQVDGLKPNDHLYLYLDAARARPIAVLDPHLNIVRIQY